MPKAIVAKGAQLGRIRRDQGWQRMPELEDVFRRRSSRRRSFSMPRLRTKKAAVHVAHLAASGFSRKLCDLYRRSGSARQSARLAAPRLEVAKPPCAAMEIDQLQARRIHIAEAIAVGEQKFVLRNMLQARVAPGRRSCVVWPVSIRVTRPILLLVLAVVGDLRLRAQTSASNRC